MTRTRKFSPKADETVTATSAAKAIDAEDLGRVPFGKGAPPAGGAEEAQREVPPEVAPDALASAPPDGSGAMALVEMALGLAVSFLARKAKLPREDYEDLRTLNEDERELLRQFAPSAEPYLGILANNAPQIGAALFAGGFALIAFARVSELRERARARAPAKTRSDDEHRAVFGAASSNIPKSTRIVDEGKFPPAFVPGEPTFGQPPFVAASSPDPLAPLAT